MSFASYQIFDSADAFSPNGTVAQARTWLRTRIKTGVSCPCCDQYARLYRRKLNATMAYALIWMCRQDNGWIDMPKRAPRIVIATNQLGTLALWEVIEQRANTDLARKHSGFWRPTERGRAFANNTLQLPTHVYLYNNKVQAWSETRGTIVDALGKQFSYRELMAG